MFKELQRDRYEGQINPVSKLRDGVGRYNFRDENGAFQYAGPYQKGTKQTAPGEAATFIFRDGPGAFTKYTGDFQDGEITGFGVKTWSSGKYYEGNFLEGEMHGEG